MKAKNTPSIYMLNAARFRESKKVCRACNPGYPQVQVLSDSTNYLITIRSGLNEGKTRLCIIILADIKNRQCWNNLMTAH